MHSWCLRFFHDKLKSNVDSSTDSSNFSVSPDSRLSGICVKTLWHLLIQQLVQNFSNMFCSVWISHWDISGLRPSWNDGKCANSAQLQKYRQWLEQKSLISRNVLFFCHSFCDGGLYTLNSSNDATSMLWDDWSHTWNIFLFIFTQRQEVALTRLLDLEIFCPGISRYLGKKPNMSSPSCLTSNTPRLFKSLSAKPFFLQILNPRLPWKKSKINSKSKFTSFRRSGYILLCHCTTVQD